MRAKPKVIELHQFCIWLTRFCTYIVCGLLESELSDVLITTAITLVYPSFNYKCMMVCVHLVYTYWNIALWSIYIVNMIIIHTAVKQYNIWKTNDRISNECKYYESDIWSIPRPEHWKMNCRVHSVFSDRRSMRCNIICVLSWWWIL